MEDECAVSARHSNATVGGGRGATYIEAVYGRDPDGVWRARSAQAYDFIQRKTPQTITGFN